jgi:hypothetical protein
MVERRTPEDIRRVGRLARQSLGRSCRQERIAMIKSDLVRVMNDAYAQLKLDPARIEELPIELEQLRRAIESVNGKVDFDVDPSDFRAVLLALVPTHD